MDLNFWKLFIRLLHYRLKAREIRYLIWRFYSRKTDKEIAKLDGRKISRQAVNDIIQRAYKKIRGNYKAEIP